MNTKILLSFAAGLGLASAQPALAVEVFVGNDAIDRSEVDACEICAFVVNQAFGVAGLNVFSFEFFAKNAGTVTPFLSTRLDDGTNANFTVTGIGQAQTVGGAGFNQFEFATVFGSSITSANTYFGFAYNDGGVVAFDYFPSLTTAGTFVAPEGFVPALGSTFSSSLAPQQNAFGALNTRTYSINATAESVAAVPEPATWALMILGFGIVGAALRRRRTRVRFNFA
jgi:hypothetical protein